MPDQDPIGKRAQARHSDPWMTVVGVCGDVIHNWFGRRNYPTLYRPFRQAPTTTIGADRPHVARPGIACRRSAGRGARVPIRASRCSTWCPMRHALHDRTIGLHYLGAIMLVFGGLALLLAVRRCLRRDGKHGHAADARDRRAHGARRHEQGRVALDGRPDWTPDRRRRRYRPRALVCVSCSDRARPVGCSASTPSDARNYREHSQRSSAVVPARRAGYRSGAPRRGQSIHSGRALAQRVNLRYDPRRRIPG